MTLSDRIAARRGRMVPMSNAKAAFFAVLPVATFCAGVWVQSQRTADQAPTSCAAGLKAWRT